MKASTSPYSKVDVTLVLLIITAFLAPIFGGYLANDATSLTGGLSAGLQEAFGGSDAPILSHALIAIPLLLATFIVLAKRRVQQTPKQIFTMIWLVFFIFLGFSSAFSSYRALSATLWVEWITYGCGMFVAIAAGGRRLGPLLVTCGIAAGCFVVALKSILEYGAAGDPSWRVFGGWINPNATAAMLLMGLFLSIGICLSQSRLPSLFSGLAGSLILIAIVLTGSKGAVSLALPIGLLAFGLIRVQDPKRFIPALIVAVLLSGVFGVLFLKNIGWVGFLLSAAYTSVVLGLLNRDKINTGKLISVLGLAAVLLIAITFRAAAPAKSAPAGQPTASQPGPAISSTPLARVSQGNLSQEQSSDFRLNLWKSAFLLIKERPLTGFGLGSYRNESARAGITTATVFAHNIYIQLWAETGLLTLLLFLGGTGAWIRSVLQSRHTMPVEQTTMLAGVFASVCAILAHSLVDSDLYYFGIGICFFILLGLGLSLSSDAVAPELIQKPIRRVVLAATGLIIVVFFTLAYADTQKSTLRGEMHDPNAFRSDVEGLSWISSFDGDALYIQALAMPPDKMITALKEAYQLYPTERIARTLGRAEQAQGQNIEAVQTLKTALESDPNNLPTLTTLIQAQVANGDQEGAVETAKRLVAVEATPYFKVRSIPESVPTETYDARLNILVPAAKSPKEAADLRAQAVRGYLPYASTTFGNIKHTAKLQNDPEFAMPGYDSMKKGQAKITTAIEAAKSAAATYRKLGDTAAADEMTADAATLEVALTS